MSFPESLPRKVARKLGWVIARREKLAAKEQARYLRRLFALLDIDLVLDVGANEGQYARFIRRDVGYSGRIVSFEPIPELAERMREAADPEWEIVNAAIGPRRGTADFNVMACSTLSSFLQPSVERNDRLAGINIVKDRIPVDVVTLDEVLAERPSFRNVYLKMDTQGYEAECLAGLSASVDRVAAMQAELQALTSYADAPPYYRVMQMIEEMGFCVSTIPPQHSTAFPEVMDFDCHFVSHRKLGEVGALPRLQGAID